MKVRQEKGFSVLAIVLLAAFLLVLGGVLFNQLKQKGKSLPAFPQITQTEKRKFVALGASTTKANNLSSSLVGDHPEYSFATGTKIQSLFQYLNRQGEKLEAQNLAESGANSQKVLSHQVPNVASMEPKYVVIDIMADVFEQSTPIQLKNNLIQIITQVKGPDTIILIGTYPNLVRMRTANFSACQQDKLGLGINQISEEKLKLFNQAIKEVAQTQKVILVDNFETLGPEDVSDYDCLHPNIEGQKKLAQKWIAAWEKEVNQK